MKVLGHRGCIIKGKPYQNSLGAFKLALEYSDGFETDACLTKDGEVVFIHEEVTGTQESPASSLPLYLDKVSIEAVNERVLQDISSAEVKTFKLKDGQKIPFFEDILPLFKNNDKTWNIELKGHNVAPVVIKKLQKAFDADDIKPQQVVVSSFDHVALHMVKEKLPQVKIGALFVAHNDPVERLNPWRDDNEGFYMPLTEQNLTRPLIQTLNPHFIIGPHTELNETQINMVKIHYPQAKVCIWVCGEYNNFEATEFDSQIERFAKDGRLATIIVDDILKHKA